MMRMTICILLSLGLGACAASVSNTKADPAQQRALTRLQKKNAILAEKMVRISFDAAKGQKAPSIAQIIDMSVVGTAVRVKGLEKVTKRVAARVCPADGPCGALPGGLIVKNDTGKHIVVLVDGLPTMIVTRTTSTDYLAPGISVELIVPPKEGAYVLTGATFNDLQSNTKADKVFQIEQALKADEVTSVAVVPDMLSGR